MKPAPSRTLAFLAILCSSVAIAAPAKVSEPAAELIQKQAPPKIINEVLDLVSPESARLKVALGTQRAFFFHNDQIAIDTPISSGRTSTRTPAGQYSILQKNVDHRSSLYGDFVDSRGRVVRSGVSVRLDAAPSGTRFVGSPMRYFMRLTHDGIGLHVGKLPGYPASHGCVRLPAEIAPLIFNKVKLGTPVEIVP